MSEQEAGLCKVCHDCEGWAVASYGPDTGNPSLMHSFFVSALDPPGFQQVTPEHCCSGEGVCQPCRKHLLEQCPLFLGRGRSGLGKHF